MFGAILKATNSSFQKDMIFCRSIYVKKVMKLLAFIFEQPSYVLEKCNKWGSTYLLSYRRANLTPTPQIMYIIQYKTFRSDRFFVFIIPFYFYEIIQH